MKRKSTSQTGQKISSAIAAGFLCWLVWTGARSIWDMIQDGRIVNRRGPDVYVMDSPILYWALMAFFATGIILASGLALVCLIHWIKLFLPPNSRQK